MKNNGKVLDDRSLACKIKVLNGHVLGTWKWAILPSKFIRMGLTDRQMDLDIYREHEITSTTKNEINLPPNIHIDKPFISDLNPSFLRE